MGIYSMLMKKCALVLALCGMVSGAALLGGCDNPEGKKTDTGGDVTAGGADRVAVVNLDAVAQSLGWLEDMKGNLETSQKSLQDEFDKVKNTYVVYAKRRQTEMGLKDGDKLTPAQQQEFAQLDAQARQTLGQMQTAANQEFQRYRGEVISQYRTALQPIIREVATKKKMTLVINNVEPVLWADSAVDITDAVEDAARANRPQLHTVTPPKLLKDDATLQMPAPLSTTGPTTKP